MVLPEYYRFSNDGQHEVRIYIRKTYKKSRHKKAAKRIPYVIHVPCHAKLIFKQEMT